jgi:hypothetical protein
MRRDRRATSNPRPADGQDLRDSRPKSIAPAYHGDHANLYAALATAAHKLVPFESGINPIAAVDGPDGRRSRVQGRCSQRGAA